MVEVNRAVELKLNPNRLAGIINSAVVCSNEIVNFHFNVLTEANLNEPIEPANAVFRFPGPNLSAEQRRAMHESWILAKAFQDLLRWVRHALEEAHVFVSLLTKRHKVRSSDTLEEFLRPFRSKAAGLKFPELLAKVNERLDPKILFAHSYKSLQLARNCLEHRNGIVSAIETHGNAAFLLTVPRLKMFYMHGGEEIEIVSGHRVQAEPGEDGVDVLAKLDVRERSIALGEQLAFTIEQFNEIAFACHFLGQQLSSKLPKPVVDDAS